MKNSVKKGGVILLTLLMGVAYKYSTSGLDAIKEVKEIELVHIDKKLDSKIDEASEIYDGNFIVRQNNKYGIMEENGKIVEPIRYDKILRLDKNTYYLQEGQKGMLSNLNNKIAYKIEELNSINNDYYKIMYNGKYGVVDKELKEVLSIKYDYIDYNDRYILAFENTDKKIYSSITGQRENLALEKENIRLGIGKFFYVKNGEKWKVKNAEGDDLLKHEYDSFFNLNEKNLLIGYLGEKKYFLNLDKGIEKEVTYDSFGEETNGIIMVLENGKIGYIDENGKEIIPPKYDGGFVAQEAGELFQVKQGKNWLLVNKEGKEYKKLSYTDIGEYKDGYILVERSGKFGYIDKQGEEVIPLEYTYANSFINGLAVVADDNGFGVIDKTNKKVTPLIYDDLDIIGNYIYVIKNNKAGLLDREGKEILPLIYDSIGKINDEMVFVKQGEKVGFISVGR